LGLPYDPSLDVWSVGCTLYELFTGKILFPGRSNNQMLRYMMEVKGKFSHKMLRRGQFAGQHFDEGLNFLQVEVDRLTNKEVTKKVVITRPTKDLKARLMAAAGSGQMSDEERALVAQFADLLDRCLNLNPEKRISVKEALAHPFCTGKV
ncbi:kinase-like domain-containing protein, partial [Jimgerdemannia flammicorona]